MKTFKTFTLSVAIALVGGLLTAGAAIAAPWVHHGSICHNYDKGQANDFDFYVGQGIKNGATGQRYTICPLVTTQTPSSTTGSVTLQYSKGGFSCWVYTYNWDGSWKGTNASGVLPVVAGESIKTISGIPNGFFYRHSVLCLLPANYAGGISGLESNF